MTSKKVVYNNLHTFMQESGDPWLEKLQHCLTIKIVNSYNYKNCTSTVL